ncbi:MAG: hypothetical protein LC634_05760 [Sphingomonadales bacterium]|nr:hypothetical protein [Sphingomonadales bacterium]
MADLDTPDYALPDIDGHSFTLFPDGPDRLAALIELIDSARTSIKLLY